MKLSTGQLIVGGYAIALVILGVVALLAYTSTRQYVDSVVARREISTRIEELTGYLSLLKDAETGQRGYLLTNRAEYLAPFSAASTTWQSELAALERMYASQPEESQRLARLATLSKGKMEELQRTVALRQQGTTEAEAELDTILKQGAGQQYMEEIRQIVAAIEEDEQAEFERLNRQVQDVANRTVLAVSLLAPLAVICALTALVLVQRDLRRRAEDDEALRQQRVLLTAIVNSLTEGVVVADEKGRLALMNPAAERLLGKGISNAASSEWTSEYGIFRTDQKSPMPEAELPLVRALRGEIVDSAELFVRPPNAPQGRLLAATAGPMDDEFGKRRGAVVILRDVTFARAAERRFQGLLESAPDALVIVNREGLIELANSQAEQLFGYSRDQMLGQPLEMLVPKAQRAVHPQQRESFFNNPRVRGMGSGLELSAERADGSLLPVEISLAPVEDGERLLVCAAIRDVTQRRMVLEQIRQLNAELEHKVALRTQDLATANRELLHRNQENEMFVYSVSHDLRSPLVNLQGFSQELDAACRRLRALAEDDAVPAAARAAITDVLESDIKESLHFIRTSVGRLSGIIDALLRLSRVGRVVYQRQEVDVEKVVRRVLDAANATIQTRQCKVIVHPLPRAAGDSTAIDQIFGNLVQNALNYVDGARPAILEIGALPQTEFDTHATYFVRDTGVGIPAAMQTKIFQAFQRLQPDIAPGEGMGLTLVQRIVERHDGRIWVESEAGVGSTFYFTLPLSPGLVDVAEVPARQGAT